ncbi:TPA: hypothetical protein U3Q60_001494 [Streptococcus agalactiae]|nr:hypothetical protein B8V62_01050 [Streptococcus agalactiae]HEN0625910.1 hypothetical protein [Streptococcus agalactiae]
MKTLSDTPKTFTFTATLPNFEQAQRAGSALIGFMVGTYDQSVIDITYSGNGVMEVEYASDKDLTESFERITNSFNHTQVVNNFDDDYISQRVFQLQNMDKQDMAELLAKYELELIDHADRLLSDEPLEFDSMHGYETIELLGNDVINLVKELDTDKQFDGIHDYVINQ